jgi:hypothetical protein
VIKIEYRRALQQNAIPAICPPQLSNFPPVDPMNPDRIRPGCTHGASSPASARSSISRFPDAFLTETALDSKTAVTYSKQTTRTFLTETRIGHRPASPLPLLRSSQSASRKDFVRINEFLTGSDLQTKTSVTPSKQTTGAFLTGARTAIKELRFRNSAPIFLLERGPLTWRITN